MGRSLHISRILLSAVMAVNAVFYSCKDDVFNAEKVKATYQEKFPVKDIDPQMDWKLTKQVTINISVYEDVGVDYAIRIYDQNPLIENSSASLLAEGTANTTTTFTTIMDCPNIQTEVFVCRIDQHNRSVVKYVSIENNQINAIFGTPPADTRASAKSDSKGGIATSSPRKSEEEIRTLATGAQEINTGTIFQNGHVYKVSAPQTYTHSFSLNGLSADNPAIIIIEGTWQPNMYAEIPQGVELYVQNGGKVQIYNTLTFVQNGNFTVYPGGSITGQNLTVTNSSQGKLYYNAGLMEIGLFTMEGGAGVYYNCGTMHVKNMNFTSGSRFINWGKAYIESSASNLIIENGCNLEVKCLTCNSLTMGDNSSANIVEIGENYNKRISMGKNSIMTISGKAKLTGNQFSGPAKEHALVKINRIENISNFSSNGNIYYEVKETKDFSEWESGFLKAIKNSEGTLSKWGEAPIVIPAGDCTGEGNTPGEGTGTKKEPMRYTYVFEDNYPLVGDYDFNDAVLDVSYFYKRDDNKIEKMQINVTLAAVGAVKTLGAGLRIVNVPKSAIDEIKTDGDKKRFQKTLEHNTFFNYNDDTHMENGDKDIVIPLFGNAHQVFEKTESDKMLNTDPTVPQKEAYTYEIIIEFEDDDQTVPIITKDNLDFFICYQYQTMKKRMEVHLYEFWKYGATAAGTVQQANLDLAGNNTWAICVPQFRYPKEYINISNQEDEKDCAYPEFLNWARNRSTSQDWYLHPIEKNVYR